MTAGNTRRFHVNMDVTEQLLAAFLFVRRTWEDNPDGLPIDGMAYEKLTLTEPRYSVPDVLIKESVIGLIHFRRTRAPDNLRRRITCDA